MARSSNVAVVDGARVDDPILFYVGGKIYEGFKDVRLSRNLTSLTGTFEINIFNKAEAESQDFLLKPGQKISCKIGKNPVFSGYIDTLNISIGPSGRNISITGRDKTCDLVDCSIVGKNEYNDMSLEDIARAILKPFGIGIIIFAPTGDKFSKFTVNQGETVFEALERLTKQRGLLMTSSPEGNLVFEKKGIIRSSTELVEGVNVMAATINFDNSERFSEYVTKGQAPSLFGDIDDNTSAIGKAYDKGIERYRPLLLVSENPADTDGTQKRAEWESSMRAARAMTVSVQVERWRQINGELWAVNQVCHLDLRSLGINQDMLLSTVRFELSTRGEITELQFIRADAFEFKPELKKESDPLDLLGWDE